MKIYCEHGAISTELREFQRAGKIELVHFPYDLDSRTRHISPSAMPSDVQWRDANITWEEAKFSWSDCSKSDKLDSIKSIIGPQNRRDALHLDSAFKTGCKCLVTSDNHILSKRLQLKELLDINIFHPQVDKEELIEFISEAK